MKAVVIYESVFGNTQKIAGAITEGLRTRGEAVSIEVGQATPQSTRGADLLVAGGPVHAWGMTRKSSRRQGAMNAKKTSITGDRGLREWFADLPHGDGMSAAAFDTSMKREHWWLPVGSASRKIAARLKARGYSVIVPAATFVVVDTEGPLDKGELEKARAWGADLANHLAKVGRKATAA
jgi:hypothetical protein